MAWVQARVKVWGPGSGPCCFLEVPALIPSSDADTFLQSGWWERGLWKAEGLTLLRVTGEKTELDTKRQAAVKALLRLGTLILSWW